MSAPRLAVTCLPCRLGRHSECHGVIIIKGGEWAGEHICSCTAPHPKGNTIAIYTGLNPRGAKWVVAT